MSGEKSKICLEGGLGEIIEKKSRFIANVRPVYTEEEATAFIEEIRKKYWDARHNCYAYSIDAENGIKRFSDDGEPSQTAGKPMLDIIEGRGIRNVCVVVTRYFGGTLLGTGGLIRAYQAAAAAGLDNSLTAEKNEGRLFIFRLPYDLLGKLRFISSQEEAAELDAEYASDVILKILIESDKADKFIKRITDESAGRICVEKTENMIYARANGELFICD